MRSRKRKERGLEQACRHIAIFGKSATERFAVTRSILKYSGQAIEFTELESEEQALACLRERSVDCLILDFFLGDQTGADFLDQVRANFGELPCPVVMLTGGLSSGQDMLLSLKAGAHDYVDSIRVLDPCLWRSVLYARSRFKITADLLSRANELSRLNQELTLKNRLKTQFLANATHELRTPLSAISGIVELARRESDRSQLDQYLETIDSCCNSLMHSVDDVLDLTRMELGDFYLNRDTLDLLKTLAEVKSSFSLMASQKNLELKVEAPSSYPTLHGDERRLKQILSNLVGNAIKHTTQGSITIRAREVGVPESPAGMHEFLFEVEDTGMGIPEQERRYVFERHYQAVNSRSDSGSGLGLFIVKEIVERMNGEVGCQSELGRGSTFWFRVPLHLKREKSTSSSSGSGNLTARILVAEDNPVLANVIHQQLKNLGCEVTIAQDGREAVELFPSKSFDLLIFDARMPRLGGLEACREIRQRFSTRVPIVLLTADSGLPQSDLSRYGLTKAFVKPLPEEKLRSEMLSLVVR